MFIRQPRWKTTWVAFCIFMASLFSAVLAAGQTPLASHLFAPLKKTKPDKRVVQAFNLYKKAYHTVNEQTAMLALDTLQQIAGQLHDQQLEGAVYVFRADYYSVNRGFNDQSLDYHQQAIDFAITNQLPVEEAIYLQKKALYYFTFRRNTDACQYFLQACEKFKQIGFRNVPNISQYLAEQAKFYYDLKDYDNAGSLLKQALHYPVVSERSRISITNTLGLICRDENNYTDALNYFYSAHNYAVAAKDTAWCGITNGNIGSVFFRQKRYNLASPLIKDDYQTAIQFKDSANAGTALLRLSRINIDQGKMQLAKAQLDTVERLSVNKKYAVNLVSIVEMNRQLAELYEKTGQLALVVKYGQLFETFKDSLNKRDNIVAVENVRLKWIAERHQTELEHLRSNADMSKFKRNALILILLLGMVIVILLFNRHSFKAQKKQELLLAEKRRVDDELANAATLLKQYTENLKQSNAIIEKFKSEVDRFKADSTDRKSTANLDKLLQIRIMTDEAWDEFKKLFNKVHSGFFIRLRKSYPNLTDTDVRLLSLVRLSLNNREMANMLGVTIEGVKKSKQRMRKKMDLPAEAELEQIIVNL